MLPAAIMKDSGYSRIPSMPGSAYASVAQGFEYTWMWMNNALRQGSEYAWSTFCRILNKSLVLNMIGLKIWQGYGYARVTHGAEYAWISLNMS